MKLSTFFLAALLSTPAWGQSPEAITALKALRSATQAGVTARDYHARFIDTKIVVDRYLETAAEGPERAALGDAFGFYTLVALGWPAAVSPAVIGASPLLPTCPAWQAVFDARAARAQAKNPKRDLQSPFNRGYLGQAEIQALWACASGRLDGVK